MAGGLDHLVIVARDLDAQADLYRRLGFQVGAQNRHAWGTLNNIVQFDGCFLELLTTDEGFQRPAAHEAVAHFSDVIVDYLDQREGLAMMVLEGFDAAADHAAFTSAGIGVPQTFYFARQGRRPDGEAVEVAFSLAFARSPKITDAGFFVCQQHAPEMFWNPAFQAHENGVTGVRRIVFAADAPADHSDFFASYTGVQPTANGDGLTFELARGAIDILTPAHCANDFGAEALPALGTPRFCAVEYETQSLARVNDILAAGNVPCDERSNCLVVPAEAAMGVTTVFAEPNT